MTFYIAFAGLGTLMIAMVVASSREPVDSSCAAPCGAKPLATIAEASITLPFASRAEPIAESTRAETTGLRLFHELGCNGCHRPDATGIGPTLTGLFDRTQPGCGALSVDEQYVRDSILNPSATVVEGFAPVMPSFASRVTEEDLQALVAYLTLLRAPRGAR
jgi:cytochrome c oxidase subunit II